jgi:glycine/D-amino acid oxidase-like deaminating enzyme
MNDELNNRLKAAYDVAIVGSGFSGTMVAVHLARAQRGLRGTCSFAIFSRPIRCGWELTPPREDVSVPFGRWVTNLPWPRTSKRSRNRVKADDE